MTQSERNHHLFILRIWKEPRELPGALPLWRGVIEHVGSGERRYVKALDEITAFLARYLEETAVPSTAYGRIARWLKRWKRRLMK